MRNYLTTRCRRGFTLVELTIAMVAGSILLLGLGQVVANHHRQFRDVREQAFGEVMTDMDQVHRMFKRFVRMATLRKCMIGTDGLSLEVYYWSEPASNWYPDCYANFYLNGTELVVTKGQLAPASFSYATDNSPVTLVIAEDVTNLLFVQYHTCIRMDLTLDNGSESLTRTVKALRHNR